MSSLPILSKLFHPSSSLSGMNQHPGSVNTPHSIANLSATRSEVTSGPYTSGNFT